MVRPPRAVREVARTTGPVFVGLLFTVGLDVVDTWFLARLGPIALAAAGLAATLVLLVYTALEGALQGVQLAVARAAGAESDRTTARLAWEGATLAALIGSIGAALVFVSSPLTSLIGDDAALVELGHRYLSLRALATPFFAVTLVGLHVLRARGRHGVAFGLFGIAALANAILDPILIFGLGPIHGVGIAGAAGATLASWILASLLTLIAVAREVGGPTRIGARSILRLFRAGIPGCLRNGFELLGYVTAVGLLARVGADALAAHQLILGALAVASISGRSFAEASAVVAARHIGAGRRDRAVRAVRSAVVLAACLACVASLPILFVPSDALGRFLGGADAPPIPRWALLIAILQQPVEAMAIAGLGALAGAGLARWTFLATTFAWWVAGVPLASLLAQDFGIGGVWAGFATVSTVELVLVLVLVRCRLEERESRAPGDVWIVSRELVSELESPPIRTTARPFSGEPDWVPSGMAKEFS